MAEIRVQVCYATRGRQWLRELSVPQDANLRSAIALSGILREIAEIDLETCRVGVYGKLKPLDAVLREHDRVEIYRPLVADPKETRRRRAAKKGG